MTSSAPEIIKSPPSPSPSELLRPKPKKRAAPSKATANTVAAATRASVADVVVVTHDAEAAAAMEWKARYEQVLAANETLQTRLHTIERVHRKALTTVKYERTLPNNDVFTKQLVEENRELVARIRELELRLYRVDGCPSSATALIKQTDRRSPAAAVTTTRACTTNGRVAVKHSSVQTDGIDDKPVASVPSPARQPPPITALVHEMKTRLQSLELDLERLRQENELLRRECVLHTNCDSNDVTKHQLATASTSSTKQQRNDMIALSLSNEYTTREIEELHSCLDDRMRQTQLLEARFDLLQERARARATLYQQSIQQLEQLNTELFSTKQRLALQQQAIDAHSDLAIENSVLRSEAHLLRSETAKLNDAIATLSSRPFESLSVDLQKKNVWIAQLEDSIETMQRDVELAQQDARVTRQTNTHLRARIAALERESVQRVEALEQCKLEHEQCRTAQKIAEFQLRFYTLPDDKMLLMALGKAVKDMRLQEDAVAKLRDDKESVLSPTADGSSVAMADATTCAVQLCSTCHQRVAVGTNPLQQQRLEKVSELTALLKEDAQAQLASAMLVHAQQMHVLRRKLRKAESCAASFLEQIRELQREKSDSLRRPASHMNNVGMCTTAVVESTALDSATASVAASDAGTHECNAMNIIEIRLHDLHLSNLTALESLGPQTSLVVLCDYYDFESQASPATPLALADTALSSSLSSGVLLPLDVSITYKICDDDAFFHSPAARALHIDVQLLHIGSTTLVAVTDVDLNALFLSRAGRCSTTLALRNPHTQARVGSIQIGQTLAHPVDAFYRSVVHASSRVP